MDKPRGRAALRAALMNKIQRPGDDVANAPETESTSITELPQPPKPRGRADMLNLLKGNIKIPGPEKSATATKAPPSIEESIKKVEGLTITEEPFKKGEKGTSGTILPIQANYIRMHKQPGKGYHRYEVRFSPEVDSKNARIKLIRANVEALGGVHVFNTMTELYLPIQLPNEKMVFETPHPFDPTTTVTITIIYKQLEPYGLQFLNVLFKKVMRILKMHPIQRNYFDMSLKKFIPQHALEIIPGYSVSVDDMEGGLMICLDTCHKMLRKKSVLELLAEIRRAYPQEFEQKAIDELLGQSVLTSYNNMNYIIDDIVWTANPTHTFETSKGPITYIDYFKNHYGLEITNKTQPLLLNRRTRKTQEPGKEVSVHVCLIPEFCNITGISQDMMTMQFRKDIAEHTRLPPAKRFELLKSYIKNVNGNPEAKKVFSDWGLSIEDGCIDLNARVLRDNKICFGGNNTLDILRCPDWGRAIGSNKLINSIDMTSWIVVYPIRDRNCVESFVARLRDLAKGFGCRIDNPRFIPINGKGTNQEYHQALDTNIHSEVQIAFIVLPMQRESLYTDIKQLTLVRKGVLGQAALVRTLQNQKNISAITMKIGLQMQSKIGGSLWAINFPNVCRNFMFCGIDTYHSKCKKMSCGAIASTIDENHTRYYTGISMQQHEITDSLKMDFKNSLKSRRESTGSYPSVVFIVRDGVGDGSLNYVRDYEMKEYLSVRDELQINFRLVFIVIQKRINTRFVALGGNNPPPGTVVDHTITRKKYEDFYLVPQQSRQGTVSPCHYIVLHNDCPELNLDRIQKLCYKLCHMYYNWTGAVSVPAPCQYAHKAAYLIGQYVERKPQEHLNDKLYYL